MATMNIYLPDALKTAMDEVPDPAPNWSGICQKSIQAEIDRLKAAQGDMDALVSRVKAAGSSQYDQGYRDGLEFAAEKANLDDFEMFADRYSEFKVELEPRDPEMLMHHLIEATVIHVDPEDWQYYTGDKSNMTWRYLDGFAKAMQETWEKIEGRVLVD